MYAPKCHHHMMEADYCNGCVEKTVEALLDDIIKHVSMFDAAVVIPGSNETEEEKLINKYADGAVQGYKDAVEQIVSFLKDLRQ